MRIMLLIMMQIWMIAATQAQSPEELFNKAMLAFDRGDFLASKELLDESLKLERNSYIAWYYKGIIHLLQKDYYESIMSFNESCLLKPSYSKTVIYRGLARQKTTDYDGALSDFNRAIFLDSTSAEALSFRGSLYELLGDKKQACTDFNLASKQGDEWAQQKHTDCITNRNLNENRFAIIKLQNYSATKTYGYSSSEPIKVGIGPDGGPANERAYLELLRDAQGKPITYKRVGSCCGYKTKNGNDGYGLLDEYEILFFDKKGKPKAKTIYLSFYEYEEPQILIGFETVTPF